MNHYPGGPLKWPKPGDPCPPPLTLYREGWGFPDLSIIRRTLVSLLCLAYLNPPLVTAVACQLFA